MFLQTTDTLHLFIPWFVLMHGSCFFNTHTHTIHYESRPVPPNLLKYALIGNPFQARPAKNMMHHMI